MNNREIVLAGAGKLASHLGIALVRKGFRVTAVYNRTPDKGKRLARKLGATYVQDPGNLGGTAGFCFIAVTDSAVAAVAKQLLLFKGIVAHTSGTLERGVLDGKAHDTGVFYPLQTFAEKSKIYFNSVPICIEGSSESVTKSLAEVAYSLTGKVCFPDYHQRQVLHLGAVIAANFSNYLYVAAEQLLAENNLDFDLLRPLIKQTAGNARRKDIFSYQTGPAVRGDQLVIARHKELLQGNPNLLHLYEILTSNIINHKDIHGKL